MPTIDRERDVLVVRVVYDGPPMSGKTTTLRTLADGLGVEVTTPAERDGRTLFFDWVDYVGGLFDGRQIRCQIVTVPGQEEFKARREKLLADADAVIFVADTRIGEFPLALEQLRRLVASCRSEDPPVGLVLQGNKRDAPDSISREQLREQIGEIAPLAVVETVATAGEGVREAFVFAVRLALDRVRALLNTGKLTVGPPSIESPSQLLEELTAVEIGPSPEPEPLPPPPVATALSELDRQIELLSPYNRPTGQGLVTMENERPFEPDPMMPGGFIWPPVDGRTFLHEVSKLGLEPIRTSRGDWWASGLGWRFHSAGPCLFEDAEAGRQALIEWARLHAASARWLSNGRSVILADAGQGRFRLWQLVKVEQSLRERLANAAAEYSALRLAGVLREAANQLSLANKAMRAAGLPLPCTLWTLSVDYHLRPMFIGLMPHVGQQAAPVLDEEALIRREFETVLYAIEAERSDYDEISAALSTGQGAGDDAATALGRLAELIAADAAPESAPSVPAAAAQQ